MRLFYIKAGDEINNQDLMVAAENPAEAIMLWRAYYESFDDEEPERAFEILPSGQAGAIGWNCPDEGGVVSELALQSIRGE